VLILEQALLTDAERARLRIELSGINNLGDVLDWAGSLSPPVSSPEVITQDEYTHDVLVPLPDGRLLAFDTT
jgi:hypothetical protein